MLVGSHSRELGYPLHAGRLPTTSQNPRIINSLRSLIQTERTKISFSSGSLSLWDWDSKINTISELSDLINHVSIRSLNILVLTSLRDWENPYLQGCHGQLSPFMQQNPIKSLSQATQVGRILDGKANVVGVVYDDDEADIEKYGLRTDSDSLTDIFGNFRVVNHPSSSFRRLPLSDQGRRYKAKKLYEEELFNIANEHNADVICSIHYLNKIQFLSQPPSENLPFGLYGRMLNIHPGIIRPPYECRGYWHHMKAIFHYHGLIFDEKDPDIADVKLLESTPENFQERFQTLLQRKRQSNQSYQIEPNSSVGASLHLVNTEFDRGSIISESRITEVTDSDNPWSLLDRQMTQDENQALIRGLLHYSSKIYPLVVLCSA